MTIAFKPLFESSTAGIPPVSQTITNLKVANKTFDVTLSSSGNTTVYTVPAGKIFFLTFYSHYFLNSAGAMRQSTITAGRLTLSYFLDTGTVLPYFKDGIFSNALPVFAGETIRITNSGNLSTTQLTAAGYETDA